MSIKSLGERRARMEFNPSNDDQVHKLKTLYAELMNVVNELPGPTVDRFQPTDEELTKAAEFGRLKSIALTELETSCMYAVKAATVGK